MYIFKISFPKKHVGEKVRRKAWDKARQTFGLNG